MITEALENLVNTLGQVQDRKRKLQTQDTMLLLGSKFVGEIEKATDTQTLSTAMLKANRIAFTLGIPELASQINNLGQIKQQELVQGKSDRLSLQQAQAYRNFYGNETVLSNGEYKNLNTIDEFNQGENLDPALQPQYYQQVANKYITELKQELDISKGVEKPMVTMTAYRKDGTERKVLKEISRTEAGWMEHLLKNDAYDLVPTPQEVTQFQSEMAMDRFKKSEENKQWEYRQSRQEHAYNQPQLRDVEITDDLGNSKKVPVWITPPTKQNPNGRFVTPQGEDITNRVSASKTYKDMQSQLKVTDVKLASSNAYFKSKEVFDKLLSKGYITKDVIKAVAKAQGVDSDIYKEAVNQYAIGMNKNFNVQAFLYAAQKNVDVSEQQIEGQSKQGWLQVIGRTDNDIQLLLDDWYQLREHSEKLSKSKSKNDYEKTGQSTNPQVPTDKSVIETNRQNWNQLMKR